MLTRLFAFLVIGCLARSAAADVTFDREVMSVLAKAGCNMGTCHGNLNGKGGFKLSLRGADPAFDYAGLTRSQSGRRVNPTDPEASLLLLKPLMTVPHEGGQRFDKDSPEYRILRDWIASGARRQKGVARVTQLSVEPRDVVLTDPTESVQLRVTATYADGSQADVSRLAVYEPAEPVVDVTVNGLVRRHDFAQTVVVVRYLDQQFPVRVAFISARPDFVWTARGADKATNAIDEHIFRRLQALRMNPSAMCDDVTFLRRASLDLTGQLPSPRDAKDFVASTASDKRARLIDELLGRQEFADFWAQKWSDLLRVEEKTLDRKGVETFHAWIRNAVARNQPIDQFVREIVSARGSSYSNPPANFYRAMRATDMRGESTAQLFLGLRLQCAKCHNHPFDQWTQADYYGWGNLFARVDYEVLVNDRRDKNDQHEFNGEQIVWQKHSGDFSFPDGAVVAPRFLGAGSGNKGPGRDRLQSLAQWLTAPTNRRFVEVSVNRVWHQLLGRGLVDPIDDFRATNPPSHPELLAELANDFVKHDFDMQWLIRTIMTSQTYQFASAPNETNREDSRNFSHALPRRLSAEQLTDAISQVTGVAIEFDGYPRGTKAIQLPGVRGLRSKKTKADDGAQFMALFGKPPRLTTCECERSSETTLAQAFQLVSGPLMNELLTDRNNRLSRWLSANQSPDELVSEVYWLTLSRAPQSVEMETSKRLLSESSDRRRTLEDIVWALMTSDEFLLRR